MDKIEIIKGHDGGSYFWIMPAKTLVSSKKDGTAQIITHLTL